MRAGWTTIGRWAAAALILGTGAIHVYGGDFFAAERSEWDPETLLEERYNVERAMRQFEEANASQRA